MGFLLVALDKVRGPYCEDCAMELLEANDHIDIDLEEITREEAESMIAESACIRCGGCF